VLGLIKWEQMAFLGNPQFGVELAGVDFSKVAEACGLRGIRIEDPARVGEQMKDALSAPGPALIEAIVDPHDMPMTPTINREHAKNLAWGLAQGQPNRERIALTMSRVLSQEMSYETSPAGVLTRAKEKVLPGGNGGSSNGD
jgi:pyruvate dehydrogenase (quinone)/pyruvate oxidase